MAPHPQTALARRPVADGAIGRLAYVRAALMELSRDGARELLPVDPDGVLGLTDPDHDVYRIELDTVSAALAAGDQSPFGRPDAVAQATVLEALHRSAELGTPVDLTRS